MSNSTSNQAVFGLGAIVSDDDTATATTTGTATGTGTAAKYLSQAQQPALPQPPAFLLKPTYTVSYLLQPVPVLLYICQSVIYNVSGLATLYNSVLLMLVYVFGLMGNPDDDDDDSVGYSMNPATAAASTAA